MMSSVVDGGIAVKMSPLHIEGVDLIQLDLTGLIGTLNAIPRVKWSFDVIRQFARFLSSQWMTLRRRHKSLALGFVASK